MSTKTAPAPKATKKPAKDPSIKLLKIMNTKVINHNSVLPILGDIYLTGKEAVAYDLKEGLAMVIPYNTHHAKGVCVPADMFMKSMERCKEPEITSDKNFGVFITEGKRIMKLQGENPDKYPLITMYNQKPKAMGNQDYATLGTITENDLSIIKNCLSFVTKDTLRPAMTGILIEAPQEYKQSLAIATDAHRLYQEKISPISETFIMPANAAKLLAELGGDWEVTADSHWKHKDNEIVLEYPKKTVRQYPEHFILNEGQEIAYEGNREEHEKHWNDVWKTEYETFEEYCQRRCKLIDITDPSKMKDVVVDDTDQEPAKKRIPADYVCFTRKDGIQVITRTIDARFPDWRAVWPQGEGNVILNADRAILMDEIQFAQQYANRSTNQVTFSLSGSCHIASQDVDFSFEYQNEVEQAIPEWNEEVIRSSYDAIKAKNIAAGKETAPYEEFQKECKEMATAFNGKFLLDILTKCEDERVSIKLWSPTKAAIVNDKFLIMPLMLNQ
jgi:DNA polymerase III sliding clamp (beta) subunit (PCNA family)